MWLVDLMKWPVWSQRTARRNAHRAAIALGQQRRQREKVDEDVERMRERRSSSAGKDLGR